jgi:hypothetical protein
VVILVVNCGRNVVDGGFIFRGEKYAMILGFIFWVWGVDLEERGLGCLGGTLSAIGR